MSPTEVTKLLAWMSGLWPKWEPTPIEVSEWTILLKDLEYGPVEEATRRHWQNNKVATRPQPFGVKNELHLAAPSFQSQPQDDDDRGYAGIACQCIKPPAHRPGLLGHCQPIYYGRRELVPRNPDMLLEQCERFRMGIAKQYGGEWVLIRDVQVDQLPGLRLLVQQQEQQAEPAGTW